MPHQVRHDTSFLRHPRASEARPGAPSFNEHHHGCRIECGMTFVGVECQFRIAQLLSKCHPRESGARPGDPSFNERHHGCRIECGMTSRHHRLPITHYLQLQPHYLSCEGTMFESGVINKRAKKNRPNWPAISSMPAADRSFCAACPL